MEMNNSQQTDVGLLDAFADWHTFKAYAIGKWNHAGFQKYFRNTGWMFASKILCMFISFFTTIFIARRLGPENLGQLNYAISFVAIFGFIASLGIDNVLFRDLIKNPEKKKEILGSAITIKLFGGIASAIIAVLFAIYFTKSDVSKFLIAILSGTLVINAFQIINYEFQARVKSKYPSIIALLVTLILNILKVLVILAGKGVIYLAFILLLESILYALFYWFTYEKKIEGKLFEWRFDKNIAISLLKDSWPLIFTSAFALVYSRIDQVLIKNMISAEAVGIYSAAVAIAEIWYFIPNIIVSSLFPAIINAKITSKEIYSSRLKKLTLLLILLSVLVAIPTTIFAPLIIKIIYGSAFISGAIILKIYVWACIGTFLGILTTNYLIAENKRGILIFSMFIPMIVNLILNLLFIPRYGIVGSAYATLISYSLGPLSLLLFKEPRKIMFGRL